MAELTIEQLIKMIIGVVVIVAVVIGVYLIFKNNIFDFFNDIFPTNSSKLFLYLIK